MSGETTASPGAGHEQGMVPAQLAALVPTFDPSCDSVEIWSAKVELLIATWPTNRIVELSTRLVLGCKGTAFQKLQLHRSEILINDVKGIKKLVELVGGTWGRIPIEKRFEIVERAVYRNIQKTDESSDSYLSRSDVVWTELLSKGVKLEEIRSYVLLRGSRLTSDDKKRVLVESGAETGSALTLDKVTAAIRMLGSGFFQEMTGQKRDKGLKTYEHDTLVMDEGSEPEAETYWTMDDTSFDDQALETLASEEDEDAAFILQFEEAASDLVQSDQELGALFSTYQDARKRLSEKVRFRGFWSVKKGDRFSKGKGKSKGKMNRQSLASRIASSVCRLCNKKGHWKNECPLRNQMSGSSSTSTNAAPTTFVSAVETIEIPHAEDQRKEVVDGLVFFGESRSNPIRERLRQSLNRIRKKYPCVKQTSKVPEVSTTDRIHLASERRHPRFEQVLPSRDPKHDDHIQESLFASAGTHGVVDLGASQTVIGSDQVPQLMSLLPSEIKDKVRKIPCQLTFRFGNHQTLVSRHALLMPLGEVSFRVAIVPGKTPFLLSSSFLKGIGAIIDTDAETLWSKRLGRYLNISKTDKNLFLMNINQLWDADTEDPAGLRSSVTAGSKCFATQVIEKDSVPGSFINSNECPPAITGNHHSNINQPDEIEGSFTTPNDVVSESFKQPSQSDRSQRVEVQAHSESCDLPPHSSNPNGDSVCSIDGISQGSSGRHSSREDQQHQGYGSSHAGTRGDRVWQGQTRSSFPNCLRGQQLDRLVHQNVRMEWKGKPCEVHRLRGETSRLRGSAGESRLSSGQSQGQSNGQEICSQTQDDCSRKCFGTVLDTNPSSAVGLGLGCRAGDGSTFSASRDRREDDQHGPREPHAEPKDDWSRDGTSRTDSTCEGNECQGRTVDGSESGDLGKHDFVFFTPDTDAESYNRIIYRLVKKFHKELEECKFQNNIQSHLKQADLFEVMCDDFSELTRQAQLNGAKAMRFTVNSADLSTLEGRKKLFCQLVIHRPKHLWFSPECGPWCKWSNLNQGKSLALEELVLGKRLQNLWQIALGIVLFRYQTRHSRHFHMEQPDGSQLWHISGIQEITNNTKRCSFDLCRVGQLKDPKTQEMLRKRLVVFTTSESFYRNLHGRWCLGKHEHKPIAGSTQVDGKTIALSKFTEHYPRRFARQVVKSLLNDKGKSKVWGLVQDSDWGLVNQPAEEHPTKRRRLHQKLSPSAIEHHLSLNINWQTVMSLADHRAPRVGTRIIDEGPLLQQVQQMCPNHEVKHLVLCRGMNRAVGPCRQCPKGLAPLRRFISLQRGSNELYVDEQWEPWERLSYRALRRKCVASRIGLTIFATSRMMQVPDSEQSSEPSADVPIPVRDSPLLETPDAKRARFDVLNPEKSEDPTADSSHQAVDLISQKHGPKMLELNKEEQAWLLKIHRNLGHPGAVKLQDFCKQLNCPDRILQAIPDLKCSVCLENVSPKIARIAAIHDPSDFGDIISMDGVTWTNKTGDRFHFYHFVDQATTFQTAIVSPSRTSGHATQSLLKGWLHWAGAPKLIVLDAATELNSEEFLTCLQRHNICSKTCAADAHWQNARAERHGGILQMILSKMDTEEAIKNYDDLEKALLQATLTKNQWSRHRGYPPELLVFGKSARIPGSVISDHQRTSHAVALQNLPEGIRFREELAIRERARKAFAQVDNDQVLRRAVVSRSRPNRGNFEKGEWVMIWKRKGEAEGNWIGPMQVLSQEGKSVVWTAIGQKLYRVAPEHVRYLSAMEEWKNEKIGPIDVRVESIKPPHGGTQFHNTIDEIRNDIQNLGTGHNDNLSNPSNSEIPSNPGSQGNPGQPHGSEEPNSSEQPDGEPEVISIPSSQGNETGTQNISADSEEPSNIPIPVETDDELFVEETAECYHLQEDQAWSFSVDVNLQDINCWRQEEQPSQMTFLVSAAKRQRSEVKLHQMTPADRELFRLAKEKEIQSWLSTETVCRVLRHQIPQENIMRCRWILTWKPVDSEEAKDKNSKMVPKARLVVLGYEDPLVHEIPRDSPTMSKLSRMLILQYAASQHWDIESFDIKTAFLRGEEHSTRVLGLEPPSELREKMRLAPNEIVKLLKGAYGRVDAPYLWYMELKKGLESLNFQISPFDPCTFVLIHPKDRTTEGIIGIHVDDGLCCGSSYFHEQVKLLEKKFPFGSYKRRNFTFTGLRLDQQPDYSIWVSQEQYVKDIAAISISRERRMTPDDPVTESERQSLRAVIGSLQYAATNSRPDLCSRLGMLQSAINKASVSTLIEANRVLHEAKRFSQVTLKIQPIPINDMRFIAFSDASFASSKVPDSHQGMVIMSCHQNIGSNRTSLVNPIVWHSKKIQKVAVSTLSAEAMSLAGAVDMLSWVRLYWGWIKNIDLNWKQADETLLQLPPAFAAIPPQEESNERVTPPDKVSALLSQLPKENSSIITTDCKSLYDLISRTAPPSCQEFRTLLQAKLIKEHLRSGVQIRWVPSQAQIADSLTKVMENSMLRECLHLGKYCLHDETEMLKQRSDARTRLSWLRENARDGGEK